MFASLLLGLTVAALLPASPAASRPAASPGPRPAPSATDLAFARRLPSFSRQTKLPCASCHYGFPQLTPFGRRFKLNGYTMTGLVNITSQADSTAARTLSLSPIAPLAVMALVAHSRTAKAVPGAQASATEFPQELSLFASTQIAPKAGVFTQFTYAAQDGTLAIDNADLRFASHTTLRGRDLLYGVSLNNNPTVQDAWNTLPAWGYPFNGSEATPTPSAAPMIDGALAQQVLGAGAYGFFADYLYAELSAYTSAPQGAATPADASAANTMRGLSPYWRVALQHHAGPLYWMVGTFGMSAELFPTGITGKTNRFRDVGVDAQLERNMGSGVWIARASLIREDQTLDAFNDPSVGSADNATNTLNAYRANVSFLPSPTNILTVGVFGTSGSADAALYPSGAVTGSASGSPDSRGTTFEYSYNPWLNVRLGAQYTLYQRFNGGARSYDEPSGRNARDNNALYLFLWLSY